MKKYIPIAVLLILLHSCSSGLEGTYSSVNSGIGAMGNYSFRFERNGKVYVSAMGMESEAKYEKDGNQIKILNEQSGSNMILTITDNNTIQGPMGTVLHKQ